MRFVNMENRLELSSSIKQFPTTVLMPLMNLMVSKDTLHLLLLHTFYFQLYFQYIFLVAA